MFIFLLLACHNETATQCSGSVMTFQRTLPKEDADDIPPGLHVQVSGNKTVINWPEPKDPNSLIVAYQIEHKAIDQNTSIMECITRNDFVIAGHKHQIKNLLLGEYSLRIRAVSLAGPGKFSEYVYFYISDGPSAGFIVGFTIGIMVVILIGLYYFNRYYIKHRTSSYDLEEQQLVLIDSSSQSTQIYVEDEWEIERDDVDLTREITKGIVFTVYEGIIKSRNLNCAAKTIKLANDHEKSAFLNDTAVLKCFSGAHHVVKLLGVVSKGAEPLVLTELMVKGDLKLFLNQFGSSGGIETSPNVLRMAAEIADGMMYLSSKKFVHRDLAARNCMVSGDLTVKIGDYGMTKDTHRSDYYRKGNGSLIPIRWMSPEGLVNGVFTTDSDVWSYGVLLWELVTFAELPYKDLQDEQVLQSVTAKATLQKPPGCPDLLHDIMVRCWRWKPNDRPVFGDIVTQFEPHIEQDFRLVSFYHSDEGRHYMAKAKERVYNAPASAAPFSGNTAVYWSSLRDTVEI